MEIRAHNRAGARAGDRVEITSSTRKTLWLCFVAYLMPVVLFIAGWLAHPAVGIALLCLSAGAAFMVNRRLRAAGGLRTEISRVVGGS